MHVRRDHAPARWPASITQVTERASRQTQVVIVHRVSVVIHDLVS
jgi:hypothetical protein